MLHIFAKLFKISFLFFPVFEVVCEKGSIKFDAEYGVNTREEFVICYSDRSKEVLNPQMKDDYEQVILHISDCLENKKKSKFLDIASTILEIEKEHLERWIRHRTVFHDLLDLIGNEHID
jgi:hypothetical protein